MDTQEKKNKKHSVHIKGGKITKKNKSEAKQGKLPKTNNLKAFKFKSANRARIAISRAANLTERKIHAPLVDRTPVEPPPVVVAIAGPSKVGKSTLLRDLLKHYVKNPIADIKGPVTVVTGKNRRVTFIEVQNDINSMIDAAKVADLILLMIDASFGFEMEAFELINICQVHGMPKIMGVLSHMDLMKSEKDLRNTKKVLKHRFWTEVYEGAKLFYLSGIINDHYLPNEIKNLARFVSVMKFRPIAWRTAHPYILVDRMEDLTDPEEIRANDRIDRTVSLYGWVHLTDPEEIRANDRIDRTVSLYGWVRGSHLKNHCAVHLPGVGDLRVKDVSRLPDPCPMPGSERIRRTLNERERAVYAPFSGLGGIVYDKDATYIETGGAGAFQKNKKKDELVEALENVQDTIDSKIHKAPLKLLSDFAPVEMDDDDEDENEDDLSEGDFESEDDEEEEVGDENSTNGQWSGLAEKALSQYRGKKRTKINWSRVVYDISSDKDSDSGNDEDELTGGIFRR
uniref:Bms1-type G domain-containing protein n=1 Tax=Panagrolaimus sp. ES5 TaxID=591445 RepID=A0AC34FV49_9BILA